MWAALGVFRAMAIVLRLTNVYYREIFALPVAREEINLVTSFCAIVSGGTDDRYAHVKKSIERSVVPTG
jgi:hypothetical protein